MKGYNTSTDYDKLWDLISNGHRIVGWVTDHTISDTEHQYKDVVEIKKTDDNYNIGYRGTTFGGGTDKKDFLYNCDFWNLVYVLPTKDYLEETLKDFLNYIHKEDKEDEVVNQEDYHLILEYIEAKSLQKSTKDFDIELMISEWKNRQKLNARRIAKDKLDKNDYLEFLSAFNVAIDDFAKKLKKEIPKIN